MVTDGMTVVPLTVLMQVLWQVSCWLLQPLRQVADDEDELCADGDVVVGVVGVPVVGDAVFPGAAGAFVSCAPAGMERPSASTPANTAARPRFIRRWARFMARPRTRIDCAPATGGDRHTPEVQHA